MRSSSPSNGREHRPVMGDTAVGQLVTDPQATYVDATYGRGGHARRILQRLGPGGHLIGLDRDPEAAVDAASISDRRFQFERTRFSRLSQVLTAHSIASIGGLLLDMGMDPDDGPSAAQWLARVDQGELRRVLRQYGDERFASSIAKAIVARQSA